MKKLLLLLFCALPALSVIADDEEVDVTSYIVNPGFDYDFTWQADGSMKEIISTSTVLSSRSYAYIAADSTVYARGRATRSDGRSDATNGFIGRIKGWTLSTGSEFPNCEWVYFGNIPYALASDAVPVADDGTTYLAAPSSKPDDDDGDDNIGALYLRAGWGGWAAYSQKVSLPCAQYRLEYWVLNDNYAGSSGNSNVVNLCQVSYRKEVVEDSEGFNAQTWTKHTIEFTPTEDFTIQFGFLSSGGSGSNPFLWIDGIKLYQIGEADEMEIWSYDIYSLIDSLWEYSAQVSENEGLIEDIEDAATAAEDGISDAETVDEMKAVNTALIAAFAKIKEAVEAISAIETLQVRIENLLNSTNYPGKDALQEKYDNIEEILSTGNSDDIISEADILEAAIKAYVFSQEASEDSPAVYTSILVSTPWFIKSEYEPSIGADGTITYPNNTDDNPYTEGSSNSDLSSDGWYTGNSGGDQRTNYVQQRSCWNAWSSSGLSMSISQDLSGLPNGYYKVSGDMITQPGCCTAQHIYARSVLEDAVSDTLAIGGWVDDDPYNGTWTTLTTGKVLVYDSTLTIGAASTGDTESTPAENGGSNTDYRRGWFCATNFQLYYIGAATEEEIAAALEKKVSDAETLASGMHLAGDKHQVEDSIAAYKTSGDLATLNNGISIAETSEAAYDDMWSDGNILPTIKDSVAAYGDAAYGDAHDIAVYAYHGALAYVDGEGATYTALSGLLERVSAYATDYAQAYNSASEEKATFTSASAIELIEKVLAGQKTSLTSADTLLSTAEVDSLITYLEYVVTVCEAQNTYEINPETTDYSGMIINADAAGEDGWTIDKGTGNTVRGSGQYYTGDATHYYFDSYNWSSLNYYGYQQISGVPNGTYTVGAYTRTSGEGAFIFGTGDGTAKSDTLWSEIDVNSTDLTEVIGLTTDDGSDSINTAGDVYGPLWAEAYLANPATDLQELIATANTGKGYGWSTKSVEGVKVTNHTITIGMCTDSLRTGKAFTGQWFSVVDWTLTLTEKGDNTGWDGPASDLIANVSVVTGENVIEGVWNLQGVRQNAAGLPRGLYIVRQKGATRKVIVK